jgi:hypothetical protein
MIATAGRFPEEPLPRLGPEGAEAPEFPVRFSRRSEVAGPPVTWPNSFRWFGKGTIRVMERGLQIIAKRRLAIGFHTTERRVVPAWEISDVYREGNSVRVELRGDPRDREFFQFWTVDASTAGTIVRLLPTNRTIEYEDTAHIPSPDRTAQVPCPRASRARLFIAVSLLAGMIGTAALITATSLRDRGGEQPLALPSPSVLEPVRGSATAHRAPAVEILNTRVALSRFDERMDGLRVQFRMAFTALQYGDLSREEFIDGVNRWLVPQWHTLYSELASGTRNDASLDTAVRRSLMAATLGWDGGLREYVRGLEERNYLTVLGALEQMSAANDAQRQARSLIPPEEQ